MSNSRFGFRTRRGLIGNIIQGLPQQTLLLDVYPNAAAAYSLRLLRGSYTGFCLRVRRSGDNSEQDIGFNNEVLDVSSLLSFVGAGSGFIARWYDQSDNARNGIQTSLANQPQIVINGSLITQNSLPAISNNGGSRNLLVNTFSFNQFFTNNFSFFGVTSLGNTDSGLFEFAGENISSGPSFLLRVNSSNVQPYMNGNYFMTANRLPASYNSISVLSSSINWTIHLNNILRGTATASIPNSAFSLRLLSGFPNFYTGTVQEMVFYNFDQTSNRGLIETNVNSFYNIYP
jgi:hypothetical protein